MNNQQQYNAPRQATCFAYTHHLPYAIRKEICNLLDADQSWRTLGGYYGLNATQLTLIGHAYLRNSSPTEELLCKLDSANLRISDLCSYLKQMNHWRALELLLPLANDGRGATEPTAEFCYNTDMTALSSTLDTPTPSFAEQPAIMGYNGYDPFDSRPNQWISPTDQPALNDNQPLEDKIQAPSRCHNSSRPAESIKAKVNDPGEEIVRMACANNRKRTSISDQEVVNQLRIIMQITYKELQQASDNFSDSNLLGNGGFASVYRGNWKGTDVAIKRLKCNLMDQALNELTILNSYRIDNILPIYGISIDGPHACLVYQFMSNGSLEDRLSCKKGTAPLSWNQRALIGEGVAKGLFYLHSLRDKPLVHGDVKSANVLLDSQFIPKLGDFGLARQVFKGKNPQTELYTHCTVSSIHGTSVYLPPEYLRHKILSPAVDVYSYGIVLLEMATGRRAYDGKRLLIELVEEETSSLSLGQIGYSLKDSRLADDTQSDLKIWFELLIQLGLSCAHKIKKKRPDMGQVLNRFAEFRTDSDQTNNNPICPSSNSSSGVQIVKPEAMNFEVKQEFEKNNIGVSQVNQAHQSRLFNANSTLMSVEEESEMKLHELNVAPKKDLSVEALLPLVTELGIRTSQD